MTTQATTQTASRPLSVVRRTVVKHPMPLFALALYLLPYGAVATGLSPFNAAEFLVWGLFALSVGLLWGYGGDLSFGHGMFFGWGAYVAGLVSQKVPNMLLALACAAVISAVVAAVLAAIIVPRAQGIYFAMITLATGQIFYFLAFRMDSVTGGETGLGGIQRGTLLGLNLVNNVPFYFFTAAIVLLATAAVLRTIRSPFGRVLKGVQQNRSRVPYLGFNVVRYRQGAFVLSASVAGLAGGLSSFLYLTVPPERLNWTTTGAAIIMTMLGGLGTLFGPFIGAALYKFLEGTLNPITNYWPALVGLVFAIVVLAAPKGIAGLLTQLWVRLTGRFTDDHAPQAHQREVTPAKRDAP
jgi:ABC-type branched-subunit amino acid transport system permease subunit